MPRAPHPCRCGCGVRIPGNRTWAEGHNPRTGYTKRLEYVPAAPMQAWIAGRLRLYEGMDLPDANARTAHDLGVPERRMYEWVYGKRERRTGGRGQRKVSVMVERDNLPRKRVEEALHHADVRFADVYADIAAAEDVELEPDGYCVRCNTDVTPIHGICPWCESPVSAEARRAHAESLYEQEAA